MRTATRRPAGAAGTSPWLLAALALTAALAFAVLLQLQLGGRRMELTIDDGGQLFASGLATVAAARAARAATARTHRRAWYLLTAGVGSWATGQLVWTWYEIVAGREVPFPSLADVGYLAFPLLGAAGLLTWLYGGRSGVLRARDLLDAALIAGSLLLISWTTTLSAVYEAGTSDRLAFALSVSYPVGDMVLATLVLLTVAREQAVRHGTLLLLTGGLGALAVADSAYVYLTTKGLYATGNLVGAGWVAGFLLIAAAAHHDVAQARPVASPPAVRDHPAVTPGAPTLDDRASWWRLAMPYVPLLVAEIGFGAHLVMGRDVPATEVVLALGLVVLVLARQFLVLTDNRSLVARLTEREAELAHQAFHDPLTGLANRSLFMDRLDQLVNWHARDGRGCAVLFCDLDDFKTINDTDGHAAGDLLLREVAARLSGAVRSVDTVARLGGDEFAVLLEAPHDPADLVAARIVTAVCAPVQLAGRSLRPSISVGVAVLERSVPDADGAARAMRRPPSPRDSSDSAYVVGSQVTGDQVLAAADRSMYLAKAGGKGRYMTAGTPPPRSRE